VGWSGFSGGFITFRLEGRVEAAEFGRVEFEQEEVKEPRRLLVAFDEDSLECLARFGRFPTC